MGITWAKWASAAFSQFPTPALREWGAYPLKPAMRETFFGPLIADVEKKIIEQQGKVWNRDLFENHLMGYSMRTKNYRLVTGKTLENLIVRRFMLSYLITAPIQMKQ